MSRQWCRTDVIKGFEGGEPMSVVRCADCNEILNVLRREDGSYYVRQHKIKDQSHYTKKMAFEKYMKRLANGNNLPQM